MICREKRKDLKLLVFYGDGAIKSRPSVASVSDAFSSDDGLPASETFARLAFLIRYSSTIVARQSTITGESHVMPTNLKGETLRNQRKLIDDIGLPRMGSINKNMADEPYHATNERTFQILSNFLASHIWRARRFPKGESGIIIIPSMKKVEPKKNTAAYPRFGST